MKAVFEVEFDPTIMWDEADLQEEMNGDWLKAMQYLYRENGIGIFENELKLVAVRDE